MAFNAIPSFSESAGCMLARHGDVLLLCALDMHLALLPPSEFDLVVSFVDEGHGLEAECLVKMRFAGPGKKSL